MTTCQYIIVILWFTLSTLALSTSNDLYRQSSHTYDGFDHLGILWHTCSTLPSNRSEKDNKKRVREMNLENKIENGAKWGGWGAGGKDCTLTYSSALPWKRREKDKQKRIREKDRETPSRESCENRGKLEKGGGG